MTPANRHLIDRKALARMKRSAFLVNTARGPIVDEEGLAWALQERLIAGAALDVYEREPEIVAALMDLENVVLAPHLGSATRESRTAMATWRCATWSPCWRGSRRSRRYDAALRYRVTAGRIATVIGRLSRAIGARGAAVEKIANEQRESVRGPDRDDAVGADARCRHRGGVPPPFRVARTRALARLTPKAIEELIYPVSFYRNKSVHAAGLRADRVEIRRRGPSTMAELLTLPGWAARPRTWC
jgi:hypothetical protein